MTPFRKPVLPAVKPAVHAGLSGESGSVTLELRRSEDGPVPRSPKGVGGFSLIFMSIFITAMAMLFVSVLPGKEDGDTNAKTISDIDKLNTVEEHMRSFMAFNGRRPCPADGQYPDTSKYFGQEAAIAGTCQGGTPAAPLGPNATPADCSGGGCIVAGVIPTRSLGLDTSYAFDSYGRRFTYVVDKRATSTATCINLEGITSTNFTATGKGGLTVSNIAGSSSEQVMYAYIQHGQSGYGAWPGDGSPTTLSAANSAARRVNSGSTDLAMQIDAGVAPGANPGASSFAPAPVSALVKNSMTVPMTTGGKLDTGFDDLVWYRDDLKNTCCLGPKCVPKGFRVDDNATVDSQLRGYMYVAAVGDVNCDGHPDIILAGVGSLQRTNLYVIFGTSNMGSDSHTPWPIPPIGFDPSTLNGTNGFEIQTGVSISHIAVGDILGHSALGQTGCQDIFIGPGNGKKAFVLFGGPMTASAYGGGTGWPATVNASTFAGYTGLNGNSGVTINTTGILSGSLIYDQYYDNGEVAIGDVDHDGYQDLIAYGPLSGATSTDGGFVIYGKPATGGVGNNDWQHTSTINVSSLSAATTGFQMYSSAPALTYSSGIYPFARGAVDINGDGYADILIGAPSGTRPGGGVVRGAVYAIYGRPRTGSGFDWVDDTTAGPPSMFDLNADLTAAPNRATAFYDDNGTPDWVTPVNAAGGGVRDLLFQSAAPGTGANPYYVLYGKTDNSFWAETYSIHNIASPYGFTINGPCQSNVSWADNFCRMTNATFADVGNGKPDLLVSLWNASPLGRTAAGATLVYYPPGGTWSATSTVNYANFKWDGTDSFQIYGPEANANCALSSHDAVPMASDVRYGDGSEPEIVIDCYKGESLSYGSIYGLYKKKGWPSSIDLNILN